MRWTKLAVAGLLVGTGVMQLPQLLAATKGAPAKIGAVDKKFMMDAAQGGMAEVKLGQLAKQKGVNKEVKQFGQHMVTDHSAANMALKRLAAQRGIKLPADMGAKNKAVYNRLAKLSGAAFDKAYVSDMILDHTEDIAEFQQEASHGSDIHIKNFASKILPTLKQHLQMATAIHL